MRGIAYVKAQRRAKDMESSANRGDLLSTPDLQQTLQGHSEEEQDLRGPSNRAFLVGI